MKYFTEIIFWLVVLSWPFYRQSMQGDSMQTFTDVTMAIAVILTLFGYWKRWQNGKKPSKDNQRKEAQPRAGTRRRNGNKK